MLTQSMMFLSLLFPGFNPAPVATPAVYELAPVNAAATKLSAGGVVDRVQKFYVGANRLTAKFRQTYTNVTFGTASKSDGKVFIKKKGKMRWDYYKRQRKNKKATLEKSFLSDGQTLWAVEHDNKQFFKKDLKDNLLPVAITFLYGEGDLRKDFNASLEKSRKYGKKSDYVLKLTPKKPTAQYKTLWLVVNPKNFRVTQSIVLEASGNTNHFRFFSPDFSRSVKDTWFVLEESQLLKKKYRLIEGKKAK